MDTLDSATSLSHIADPKDVLRFILAGDAYMTIVSKKTGTRFTYRVSQGSQKPNDTRPAPHFVAVLVGPDHYAYLGTIFGARIYTHGRKSTIHPDASSARAFAWLWQALSGGRVPTTVEVHHEGRCGRCGRRLTVPESIQTGLGPECLKKAMGGRE